MHNGKLPNSKSTGPATLRESEQRLRLAIKAADLGTWDWDLATGELLWSDRCKEMFGYPPETAMTYELFLAALHPEDRDRVDAAVQEALRTGAPYDVEFRSLWRDGTVRWVSSVGSVFGDSQDGPFLFMRGVAVDITVRKRAEAQAAEHAERFQFLAESLPEKIFTATGAGDIGYLNQQWADYTGLPVPEVLRLGWREFVHPEDIEEKMRLWIHAMRHGTPFEFEHRFRRADGEYRWHLSRARPMRRTNGEIAMWVGSNIDVHDLKQAQFELGESESRSRLAMQAAGLGFWDWNWGGRLALSPELNRMFGLDENLREGPPDIVLARLHPDDRPLVNRALERALGEKVDFESEFRTVSPGGKLRWVAAHGRVYYGEDGHPVRMIGMVRDITERKGFEEQVRRQQHELRGALAAAELAREVAESANRAKDQFLAVLSHELRTPLTPVLMAVSFLGRDKNITPQMRDALQMIQRNIQIEARLIEDLLDLTRIARNKLELQKEPMDLHVAIRQAVEVCAADIEGRRHRLEVSLRAEQSHVSGDVARLQQVFWNIIKNAVKFTPDGGLIHIASRNEGTKIIVEISDSGMGIPAEALPRIFKPFEQGNQRAVREAGGLGLGLAISKATIEGHQGALVARSGGQNEGATFVVILAIDER